MESLWGDYLKDLGRLLDAPVRQLKVQARFLSELTDGKLCAYVSTCAYGDQTIKATMYVGAPSLGPQGYELLHIKCTLSEDFYPLEFHYRSPDFVQVCSKKEEFEEALKRALQERRTRNIVGVLLAHVENVHVERVEVS